MGRRVLYLVSAVCVLALLAFAVALPDARLGFATLAAAIVAASWWLTRRLPARPVTLTELRASAAAALLSGVTAAVLIPSSRIICDCPPPVGGGGCHCGIDHHVALRLSAAAVGIVVALAFGIAARMRTSMEGAGA